MIVVVITENEINNILPKVNSIKYHYDIIELRLDYLNNLDVNQIKSLLLDINKPVIFTLRSQEQGGFYQGSEHDRLVILDKLAKLLPDYIDLESTINAEYLSEFKQKYPDVKIIRSYHNFECTPMDLDCVLTQMQNPSIDIYKVVTFAKTSLDNLKVMHFLKKHVNNINLTAFCMGELSLPSRIIGKILGNHLHYTHANNNNIPAPFCPDLSELLEVYNFNLINNKTKVFALLGNPVAHSIGHIFHNKKYNELKTNAVYIKIKLETEELNDFFDLIKNLPFGGFSVTTPFKIDTMFFIDKIDLYTQNIGSINTIKINNNKLCAINTDGIGTIDAIEQQCAIKGKNILVIGAGGTARAIVHEISKRTPASLSILNRNKQKALDLATNTNAKAYDFKSFKQQDITIPDIIINTLPSSDVSDKLVFNYIEPFLTNKVVYMSTDYSNRSSVLSEQIAIRKCKIIGPLELFNNQAQRQIDYWFSSIKYTKQVLAESCHH